MKRAGVTVSGARGGRKSRKKVKRAGGTVSGARGLPVIDMGETRARFQQQVGQRLQQLISQLEINAKFNRALAEAAEIDPSKLPLKLRRELDKQIERTFKAKPPPLPND
jgi:hypothetical protein